MKFKIKASSIFYFILALFLAIFLWVYMMVVQNPEKSITYRNISVKVIGRETLLEDKGLSVIAGVDGALVSVSLRGKYSDMVRVKAEDIIVEADLEDINSTGEGIRVECSTRVPRYNNVEVLEPNSICVYLTVDKIIDQEIPVSLKQEVVSAEGFRLGSATLSPTTVIVKGPMSEVSRISYAQVSLISDEEVSARVDAELPVTLVDADGNALTLKHTACLTEKVNVTLPVLLVKEVPLAVNIANEGSGILLKNVSRQLSPSTITIAGERSALESIESINVGTVDLNKEWESYEYEYTFPVKVPEGIQNLSEVNTVDVKISLVNTIIKSFIVKRIELINPPTTRKVTAVTEQVEVNLRGDQELLNALTADRIRLVVDLTKINTATGKKTLPASVIIEPASPGYIPLGKYNVVVEVKRK